MTDKFNAGEFVAKDVEQDLNRLLSGELTASTRRSSISFPLFGHTDVDLCSTAEFDLKVAMASTSALISYLALMADDSNFDHYHLRSHDLSQFMKLDASALRALNCSSSPAVVDRELI